MNQKNCFFTFLILLSLRLSAQDIDAFQPDSIYKVNKVKRCKVFDSNSGFHHSTTYFDESGRIVRLVKSDNVDLLKFEKYYTEINTYYLYSEDGRLIDMIDSVKTRMPVVEEREAMKEIGPIARDFLDKLGEFPPLSVNTYELIYENEELILTNKYDLTESLLFSDSISKEGGLHKKYLYKDQVLEQVEFISYTPQGYPRNRLIQVNDGGYWYASEYSLTYDFEGDILTEVTGVRDDDQTAKTKYFYDEKGLVIKRVTGFFGTDQQSEESYIYEYYE